MDKQMKSGHNLYDRVYINTRSTRRLVINLYTIILFGLFLSLIVLILLLYSYNTLSNIDQLAHSVQIADKENTAQLQKSLDDVTATQSSAVTLLFYVVIFLPPIIWELYRGYRVYQKFKEWSNDFRDQQYILYFETTIPKGDTSVEKVLSLARLIFPEIRDSHLSILDRIKSFLNLKKTQQKEPTSQGLSYSKSYNLHRVLKTKNGYFIVKDFEDKVVTFEDLKELVRIVGGRFKSNVFRIIVVAKEYDDSFYDRKSLHTKMRNELVTLTDRTLKWNRPSVDLLLEYKAGYSVLWID